LAEAGAARKQLLSPPAAEAKKKKIGDYKLVIRGLLFVVVFSNYLCVNSINSFLCGEKIYD